MSYNTTVRGEITFDPPLRWFEAKESSFYDADPKAVKEPVVLKMRRETTETDEGELTVVEGIALVPWTDEGYRTTGGGVHEAVERFVKAHKYDHATGLARYRGFTGELRGEGEHLDDIWRVVPRWDETKQEVIVHLEYAKLSWPDGSAVDV